MKRRIIKISQSCNNNCCICSQLNKKIDTRQLTEIKEELIGLNKGDAIIFPCNLDIQPFFIELLNYTKTKELYIILETNGRLFYYMNLCEKVANLIDEFHVLLFGHNPELHEKITQTPNSFEQAINGIKNLKNLNKFIKVNLIVTKENYKFLEQIVEFFADLNVDLIQIIFLKGFIEPDESLPPYVEKALDVKYKKYEWNGLVYVCELRDE